MTPRNLLISQIKNIFPLVQTRPSYEYYIGFLFGLLFLVASITLIYTAAFVNISYPHAIISWSIFIFGISTILIFSYISFKLIRDKRHMLLTKTGIYGLDQKNNIHRFGGTINPQIINQFNPSFKHNLLQVTRYILAIGSLFLLSLFFLERTIFMLLMSFIFTFLAIDMFRFNYFCLKWEKNNHGIVVYYYFDLLFYFYCIDHQLPLQETETVTVTKLQNTTKKHSQYFQKTDKFFTKWMALGNFLGGIIVKH